MNVLGMSCPYCDTWSTIRSSEKLSPLVRAVYFQCRNLHCGLTWKAHLEAVAIISPSSFERPDIKMPMSPYSERLQKAAEHKSDPRQRSLLP